MADSTTPAPDKGQPGEVKQDTKTEIKTEAKTETKTAVSDPPDTGDVASPTDWPDDWRQRIAGQDEKTLKRLERMGSIQDIWKSYTSLEKKLSDKAKAAVDPFPAEGTEEDQNAWRSRQGVPAKPDEYLKDFTIEGGLVIGEADKPVMNEVLSAMHKEHASPKVVRSAVNAYYKQMEKTIQEQRARDNGDIMAVRDSLRDEYGAEAQSHLQAAKSVIEMAPESIRDILASARLPNGRLLGNDPDAIRWLRDVGLEMNPAATVVPGSPGKSAKGVAERLTDLRKMMTDRDSDYWRGPKAESLQAEYRKLVEAEEKLQRKSA